MPGSIHDHTRRTPKRPEWWEAEGFDEWGDLEDDYLDRPEQWVVLARVLRAAGIFGLDTEFYGLDVRKESCVGKARVHVWSVAIRSERRSPLGFAIARGWVLPVEALTHPDLVAVLEDPTVAKPCHNQPVDDHAVHNHGVNLRGCINTLGLARWMWPELVTAGGFGLKNLMLVKLRRPPVCEFKDVVSDERTIQVTKDRTKQVTVCSCGVEGCRARKGHTKSKVTRVSQVVTEKIEKFQHPLESIGPGHPRFKLLVEYAGEDAVAALEVEELARYTEDPAPFPYATGCSWCGGESAHKGSAKVCVCRPKFNQDVENEIVAMEREGFPIDVPFCAWQAECAMDDEDEQLAWLHKWFVVNGALIEGPHRREDVDPIWSSPKQTGELFDSLDFPRSPIWKKGRVKPGEIKLDSAALKWVAKNYRPAKQVIEHLLKLKVIRSGKKYLTKLRDSGGYVHPICGPAGDADDRNGAVTGRLGIKGTLEAQQLPSREEADLYHVRKAIVAERRVTERSLQ
jgi:hypothetical protein